VQKFREESSGAGIFLPDLFTPFTASGKDVERRYEKRVFN